MILNYGSYQSLLLEHRTQGGISGNRAITVRVSAKGACPGTPLEEIIKGIA